MARECVLSTSSLCGLGKLSLHHIIEWISRSLLACSASRERGLGKSQISRLQGNLFRASSPLWNLLSEKWERWKWLLWGAVNNLSQKVSHDLNTWWHFPSRVGMPQGQQEKVWVKGGLCHHLTPSSSIASSVKRWGWSKRQLRCSCFLKQKFSMSWNRGI